MKKIPTMLMFFAFLFFLAGTASAQTLEQYNIDFHIAFNKIVVEEEMVFDSATSGNALIDLPSDADGISLYVDDIIEKPSINDNQINIQLNSSQRIRLDYVTKELIDRSDFLVSLKMPYDASNLRITLTLPEDASLESPIPNSSIAPSPVYPLPDDITTDGRQIKLIWDYTGLKKGDDKSIFVKFKEGQNNIWLVVLLALVIAGLIIFIVARKPKVEKIVEKVVEVEDMLEKHLKEDEEQIVNILKQREGKCEQGTLRVITGFSKAKLSGLLKELEERKVIHKEKRGKKNLVFLKNL